MYKFLFVVVRDSGKTYCRESIVLKEDTTAREDVHGHDRNSAIYCE